MSLWTWLSASGNASAGSGAQERRPNVIVILADDMGYGDLGVQGNSDIPAPNIDSIAANGVRFTDGYVTAPVCSPSRAGLLSGRYQQRFGHEFNPGGRPRKFAPIFNRLGLPTDQVLLPRLMKDAGYATGMVGKWHLGYAPQFLPQARGFDEFFDFLTGAHSYIGPGSGGVDSEDAGTGDAGRGRAAPRNRGAGGAVAGISGGEGGASPIYRGTTPVQEHEYLTDAFGREAVAFIERHKSEPFFLYLPFNAVHAPLEAVRKYIDRVSTNQNPNRRIHAAMTVALHDAVGRILGELEQANLTDKTSLIFLSDKRGVFRGGRRNYANNGPLRAGKLSEHEGGTRVPFMMQWPGKIKAGEVYRQPVRSLDILPTALAVAGGKLLAVFLCDLCVNKTE